MYISVLQIFEDVAGVDTVSWAWNVRLNWNVRLRFNWNNYVDYRL